jgi:hypothetical protein
MLGKVDRWGGKTCCFGLKKERLMGKVVRKKWEKVESVISLECQIKGFGYLKEGHEVIII